MFGLLVICGYQFAPRIADIGDAQMCRLDLVDVGLAGQPVAKAATATGTSTTWACKINVRAIRHHRADMLHVAGSLVTNQVRAYNLLRMRSADGRLTGLGAAFARKDFPPDPQSPGAPEIQPRHLPRRAFCTAPRTRPARPSRFRRLRGARVTAPSVVVQASGG
nr:Tn3 family transposase [Nonomuraea mesophila]